MSAAWCAATIANLEGYGTTKTWLGSKQPGTTIGQLGLDGLDRRTVRLEAQVGIDSPPPMLSPTWDSLVYRVRRLERRVSMFRKYPVKPEEGGSSTALPQDDETLAQSTKRILVRLFPDNEVGWLDGVMDDGTSAADDKKLVAVSVQLVAHLLGKNNYKLQAVPEDLEQTYNLLMGVSVLLDTYTKRHSPGPPPGPPLPGPRYPPGCVPPPPALAGTYGPKKLCCGCCNCNCHSKEPVLVNLDRVRVNPVEKSSKKGGSGLLGWLRSIFRRKRDYDDTVSVTSTTVTSTDSTAISDH